MLSTGARVTTPAGEGVIASMRALGLHGEPGVFVQLDGWNGGGKVFLLAEVTEIQLVSDRRDRTGVQ